VAAPRGQVIARSTALTIMLHDRLAPSGLGQDVRAGIADGHAEHSETLDDARGSAWYRTGLIRASVRRALELTRLRAAKTRGVVA
jgi:CO/xanthine dehydrogenase FAD-binding subunit